MAFHLVTTKIAGPRKTMIFYSHIEWTFDIFNNPSRFRWNILWKQKFKIKIDILVDIEYILLNSRNLILGYSLKY